MTPEETKHYLEERLNALGWAVHIGTTGYEKIFRFTEGNEDGARRLYHKLLALGGLQETREINDDLLDMAMIDLASIEAPTIGRAVSEGERRPEPAPDLASIEQLAAVLEAKMADGVVEEVWLPKERARGRESVAVERPKPAALRPKALVIEPAPGARARIVEALALDFTVIEASDGEEAWKLLVERSDIEIMVTGLALPTIDGCELIRRARGTPRPHLAALPIVAVANEDAVAKLRALTAGANDFLVSDVSLTELRSRALTRHRLGRSLAQANRMHAEKHASAETRIARPPPASARRPVEPADAAPEELAPEESVLETLSVEPRLPRKEASRTARRPATATRDSVIRNMYRISATTTITLSATALLAIAIVTILYIGRNTTEGIRPPATEQLTKAPTPPAPKEESPIYAPPPSVNSDGSRREQTEGRDSAGETDSSSDSMKPAVPERSPSPSTAKAPERSPPPHPSRPNDNTQPNAGNRPAAKTLDDTPTAPEPEAKPDARTDLAASAPARVTPPAPIKPEASVPASPVTPPTTTSPSPAPSNAAPSKTAPPRSEPNADTTPSAAASTPEADVPESGNAPPPTAAVRPGVVVPMPVTPAPPPGANPPAPSPAATKISRDELSAFLRRFAAVYETGDMEQFIGLFADNARTNDRIGRKGIRDDYDTLFRSTDMRRMKLGQMSWEIDGNQAYGWGDFDVTVRRSTDRSTYAYSGSMTFVVEKVDGRIRIVRLYHDQRRVGARS